MGGSGRMSVIELPDCGLKPPFEWPPAGGVDDVEVVQEVLIEGKAMVLRNVLSARECQHIIDCTEANGFDPLTGHQRTYRTNDRQVMDMPGLALIIHARVAPFLPQTMERSAGYGDLSEVKQTWNIVDCNSRMRFCKYYPGGFFKCHQDGRYMRSAAAESVFTVNLYLNGGFAGGETNFLEGPYTDVGDRVITHQVVPEAGMALVFLHPLYHEGDTLQTGVKYLARTEVMYERVGVTSVEEEAMGIFKEAEFLEDKGDMTGAIRLYKKAFKLCPALEERMR